MERVIDGEESQSTTSIIGDDGRKTVAIVVDYAWHPGKEEVEELEILAGMVGKKKGPGSKFDSLDSIVETMSLLVQFWKSIQLNLW